tara:strand:+ start:727 stop:867 length:141 start_codon:yes stop_codon:yes gene_type:complete
MNSNSKLLQIGRGLCASTSSKNMVRNPNLYRKAAPVQSHDSPKLKI